FQQLRGIAALTVVLTVAGLSATATAADLALSTAAAPPATLLSIVDQMYFPTKAEVLPLGLRRTGSAHSLRLLTLSFRSKREARSGRPIASGVGGSRSTACVVERDRPCPRCSVPEHRCQAISFKPRSAARRGDGRRGRWRPGLPIRRGSASASPRRPDRSQSRSRQFHRN